MVEDINNKKNEINKLNEKIEEINNNNKILTNKLDEMNFNYKNLEQEKNNLKIKISKIEEDKKDLNIKLNNREKIPERKIIITNSDDYQPEDEYSDIIYNLNNDKSLSKRNEDQNLVEINKKLQEKVNQLQLELNQQLLSGKTIKINNRNKIMNNNYIKNNR